MFYLYEIQAINHISQYMLTKTESGGVITAFDAASDEGAMDMASIYITNTLGKKKEFGISLSL
ncbi:MULTISPECIES: hypothetical protein [Klebsiella]|uniref:hypothetical protein n=1 Tax=Klebsiella TaxID=570 RepID=UPI0006687D2D|nr:MULTISPECIES: hypothetical protein [Klebsiella]ELO7627374.1 hypothetical protein [Klebsiella michiganensis]TXU97394.1 hypothetical protein D4M92_27910 [Klebsiella michiganensis]BAS41912.1 phage-related protein, tail component [Klebsiella oxytoca]